MGAMAAESGLAPRLLPTFHTLVYNVTYYGDSCKLTTTKLLLTHTSSLPHIYVGPKIAPPLFEC